MPENPRIPAPPTATTPAPPGAPHGAPRAASGAPPLAAGAPSEAIAAPPGAPPRTCQDYFIRNGIHVGDYEGMYRDCPDPWRIEELGLRLDMRAALLLLDSFPPVARGQGGAVRALDAGAGAGLFSLEVYEALNRRYPAVEMTLNDISPTALAKARARFVANAILPPEILAYDLRRLAGNPASGSPAASVSPAASPAPAAPPPSGPLPPIFSPDALDLIVLAQGLWGIVDGLAGVMRAFRRALGEAGTLLVSQHFPGLENQSWGREVAAPADMADVLRGASFELIAELETGRSVNHHWGSLWRSI